MADFARSADPAVQRQLDRLGSSIYAVDVLGLERISALLERLGRPQDHLPPLFHVAGTNGKGSTCAFLRAALEAAGHRVHAFTSPHLVRFNERIRIAGKLIEDSQLAPLLEEVLDAGEGLEATFFEVTTAAALLAFARNPADAVILEVGLGGRLDATNVVDRPLVTAIASLGLDHQIYLGDRLTDIAAEKAGIAKRGVALITQAYSAEVAGRVAEVAAAAGALVVARGASWVVQPEGGRLLYRDAQGELSLPLPSLAGEHQVLNAGLAIAMLRHQSMLEVPHAALAQAMRSTEWPARLQQLASGALIERLPRGSELWIDGGHNQSAALLVAAHAREAWSDGLPLTLIFASLRTKDAAAILAPFRGIAAEVRTLPIAGHDSRDPGELAKMAHDLGFAASAHQNLDEALAAVTAPARVLVFGSLYLAGLALSLYGSLPD
ncbi:MAG TPA: folylpolyglutamate synthase/dihydrofolate synthase family protein [Sphingomicrobium sp.]|nr:folylpolyglutamate synthase/dihydrofolate synthase family protein [Sphingomicrobium sp.]